MRDDLRELSVFRRNYLRGTYYKSIEGRAIGGSELSAGTHVPDHERGGAMYDRRSRQPITPQRLITPPADECRVVRDFLAWMPITRSAC